MGSINFKRMNEGENKGRRKWKVRQYKGLMIFFKSPMLQGLIWGMKCLYSEVYDVCILL